MALGIFVAEYVVNGVVKVSERQAMINTLKT